MLDGVNHGFHCNAAAVLKEPLAQNKHALHIDARTDQSMQNFACLMVNGDLLPARQGNVIDEYSYLISFKKMYLTRFLIEQHTQWA